jgi:hypothetical protein
VVYNLSKWNRAERSIKIELFKFVRWWSHKFRHWEDCSSTKTTISRNIRREFQEILPDFQLYVIQNRKRRPQVQLYRGGQRTMDEVLKKL